MALRIGLSACFFHADPQRAIFKGKTLQYVEQSMARWVQSEGALAYLIPSPEEGSQASLASYASDLDGLVLQGGSDLSPLSYGEKPIRPEWSGDRVRDVYELELVREFLAARKPVLGVCRGYQLLNVAFGGTLYQDIAFQLPDAGDHRNWEAYDSNHHRVVIEPTSLLARLYGGQKLVTVNSIHHQAVKSLGKDLVVEAKSERDGIVEAFRRKVENWVFGVQWHPEFHADPSLLDGAPLIREFLKEAQCSRS